MKPGPVGTFRASCNRLREDHQARHNVGDNVFCEATFDNFAAFEAHLKEVHPNGLKRAKSNRTTGTLKPITTRKRPFGAPAVKYEKQAVEPGTRFTYKGYDCQVIGAASSTRTKYLVWLPDEVDPSGSASVGRRHFELGKDENGMWTWELTVPTKTILEAIAISENAA